MGRGGGEMRASFSSRYDAAADGEGALLLLLLVIALPLRVPMMLLMGALPLLPLPPPSIMLRLPCMMPRIASGEWPNVARRSTSDISCSCCSLPPLPLSPLSLLLPSRCVSITEDCCIER